MPPISVLHPLLVVLLLIRTGSVLAGDSDPCSLSFIREEAYRALEVGFSPVVHQTLEAPVALPDGRVRLRLREGQGTWHTQAGADERNPQGHPWTIYRVAGGPEVPQVLGFRVSEPGVLDVPSAPLLQRGVDRLNASLPPDEQIPIHFRPSQGKEPPETFLRNYATDITVPISSVLKPAADRSYVAVHDISFHVGAIYISPRILRHSQLQVRAVIAFIDYLKTEMPGVYAQIGPMIESDWLPHLALKVDAGHGNFSSRHTNTSEGTSFDAALNSLLMGVPSNAGSMARSPEGVIMLLASRLRDVNLIKQTTGAFQRFKASLADTSPSPGLTRQDLERQFLVSRDSFDAEVNARRARFQTVARELLSEATSGE